MAHSQKKRTPKTSAGVNGGGGKNPHLTQVQLINMGKGLYTNVAARYRKPVGTP